MSERHPIFREFDAEPGIAEVNANLLKVAVPSVEIAENIISVPIDGQELNERERSTLFSLAGYEVTGLELAWALTQDIYEGPYDPVAIKFGTMQAMQLVSEEGYSPTEAIRESLRIRDEHQKRKLAALKTIFNSLIPDPVAAAPGNEMFDGYFDLYS